MILESIFTLFFSFFDLILGLIPSFNLGFSFSVLSPLSAIFSLIDSFINIKVIFATLTLAIIRDNFVFLKNIFLWLLKFVPFVN